MYLSVIIVNYNVCEDVIKCIASLKEYIESISYEIIVVDNNSTGCEISGVKELYPDVILMSLKHNLGFGNANNEAMKIARGKYLLLVNPDIIFTSDVAVRLCKYLDNNSGTGVVGPMFRNSYKNIEYVDTFFPTFFVRIKQTLGGYNRSRKMKRRIYEFMDLNIENGKPFNVDNVMGACMLVRKEIFDTTGGFDDSFFLYEEETEWQYRISNCGWDIKILPDLFVIHNHHSSINKMGKDFGYYHFFRSRIIYSNKHYGFIKILLFTLLFTLALSLRIIYNFLLYLWNRNKYHKKKLLLQLELLRFNLKNRRDILTDKYDFEKHIDLFPQ